MSDEDDYLNAAMHGGGSSDSHSDDSDTETEEQQLQRAMVQSLSMLGTPASSSPPAAANTADGDDEDAEEEDAEDTDDEEWRDEDAAENGWTWGTGGGGPGNLHSAFQAKKKKTILLPGEKKALKQRHMAEVRAGRSAARAGFTPADVRGALERMVLRGASEW